MKWLPHTEASDRLQPPCGLGQLPPLSPLRALLLLLALVSLSGGIREEGEKSECSGGSSPPRTIPHHTPIGSLVREDPLEKGMATHSRILAWRIPWTEEPGRLQSVGPQRVSHD